MHDLKIVEFVYNVDFIFNNISVIKIDYAQHKKNSLDNF